jgi:serine protease Do
MRPAPLALALLCLAATPAPAQERGSAWRMVNRTGQEAVGLTAVAAGETGPRGRNRLRQPVADGAEKGFRRGADTPCRLDLRLRLADGREAAAPGQDVCAQPLVVFEAASVGAATAAPGRGTAGGRAPTALTGTGFIVAPNRVMTSQPIVEGCARITLQAPMTQTSGGTRHEAVPPIRTNRDLGLALLSVPSLSGPALSLREDAPRRGEGVVASGFPANGTPSPKTKQGEVGGLAGLRDDPNRIRITAPLPPGYAGAPVLDLHGRVLGIGTPSGRRGLNGGLAVRGDRALAFLRAAGVTPRPAGAPGPELGAEEAGALAGRSVVLIRCEKAEGAG